MDVKYYYCDGEFSEIRPSTGDYFIIDLSDIGLNLVSVKGGIILYRTHNELSLDVNFDEDVMKSTCLINCDDFFIESAQYRKIVTDMYNLLNENIINEELGELMNITTKYLEDLYVQYSYFREYLNRPLISVVKSSSN